MTRKRYIVGIDEVGRGALAGPVTVGVVAIDSKTRFSDLRDSKKLTPKGRERWFSYLKKRGDIRFAVASVPPKMIDRMNVSRAANLAATRAFQKLTARNSFPFGRTKVFLDGGLYLRDDWGGKLKVRTVVRGDEKINAIKLASIAAKVHRDRLMGHRHEKYPRYDFSKHKGYGTASHMRSLRRHGLSEIHRKTFCRKFVI